MNNADKASDGILKGCVVLDLSTLIAGPFSATLLADLGADVIKAETPWRGDDTRYTGVLVEDESTLFIALNRNKKSISLNLKTPEGREILERLIARSDILIENFRPDIRSAYALEYEQVQALKPNIIYLSVTSYGEDGPYSSKPGTDHVFQGLSGIMSISGEPGQGPLRFGVPVADMTTALYGAYAVLGALLHREHTGEGQLICLNLLDAAMCLQTIPMTSYLLGGVEPLQTGNDNPFAYPVGCFKSKDGYVNISAFSEKFWQRLCVAMELDELIDDPRFNSEGKRLLNKDELKEILTNAFSRKTTEEWLNVLGEADIPSGPFHTYKSLFSDPQVVHNSLVRELPHSKLKKIRTLGNPIRFGRTPAEEREAAPLLGEHTESVLSFLGYSTQQIEELKRRKAI